MGKDVKTSTGQRSLEFKGTPASSKPKDKGSGLKTKARSRLPPIKTPVKSSCSDNKRKFGSSSCGDSVRTAKRVKVDEEDMQSDEEGSEQEFGDGEEGSESEHDEVPEEVHGEVCVCDYCQGTSDHLKWDVVLKIPDADEPTGYREEPKGSVCWGCGLACDALPEMTDQDILLKVREGGKFGDEFVKMSKAAHSEPDDSQFEPQNVSKTQTIKEEVFVEYAVVRVTDWVRHKQVTWDKASMGAF